MTFALKELSVLFIDLQATGSSIHQHHPFEFGWMSSLAKDDLNHTLLALPPGVRWSRNLQKWSGLKAKDFKDAQSKETCLHAFEKALSSHTHYVAHYASYEQRFLSHMSLSTLGKDLSKERPWMCTHQISTRLFPALPRRSLHAISGLFGLPLADQKRVKPHLQATAHIWPYLCHLLHNHYQVYTFEDLDQFLKTKPKRPQHYLPPLPKELRLNLPHQPGVYQLLNLNHQPIYIGVSEDLKRRVSQHFTGKKHHSERHLEMISQVFSIHTQTCSSRLEAYLLEAKQLQHYQPHYNRKGIDLSAPFYRSALNWTRTESKEIEDPQSQTITLNLQKWKGPWIRQDLFEELKKGFKSPHSVSLDTLISWGQRSTLSSSFLECLQNQVNPLTVFSLCQTLYKEYELGLWIQLCSRGTLIWHDEVSGWRMGSLDQNELKLSQPLEHEPIWENALARLSSSKLMDESHESLLFSTCNRIDQRCSYEWGRIIARMITRRSQRAFKTYWSASEASSFEFSISSQSRDDSELWFILQGPQGDS